MPDAGFREGETWKTGSAGKRERMAVYVEWLLTPQDERKPSTKKDLAVLLDVTTATLRNYTQDPWLQKELTTRARATAKVERLPDILASLYDQAIDRENPRSVAAAKTYMDFLRQAEEARELENLEDMSNDDLLKVVNELLSRQVAAETEGNGNG